MLKVQFFSYDPPKLFHNTALILGSCHVIITFYHPESKERCKNHKWCGAMIYHTQVG